MTEKLTIATEPKRKPPRADLTRDENNVLHIVTSGDYSRILTASGNAAVSEGLVCQLSVLGSQGKSLDAGATDFALGFVDSMKPKDAVEALLVAQMAAIHSATMMLARRLNHVESTQQQDASERALNKLARTFTAQVDTLKRYRSKVHQTVRVERVTVQEGGQAIVGNVEARGRDDKT